MHPVNTIRRGLPYASCLQSVERQLLAVTLYAYSEVGLGPGDFVEYVDSALPPQKWGRALQFWVHICCGQKAGWIKMPLGTEVGLGPGDIALHGDPAPCQKGHSPPMFGPCLLWPNSCMYQDTTRYGGRPQPRQHCVR